MQNYGVDQVEHEDLSLEFCDLKEGGSYCVNQFAAILTVLNWMEKTHGFSLESMNKC